MEVNSLDGIEQEGTPVETMESVTDLSATKETETPPASSPETKPNETTPAAPEAKQESAPSVPFHEDPKIQDYINRQVEKKIQESKVSQPQQQQPPAGEQQNIPSWFAGDRNDPQTLAAWKEFSGYLSTLTATAKAEAVKELKAQQEAETQRIKEAQEWFQQSIASIEGEQKTTLSESDRNKLMKFVYDNYIVDDKGRWNYSKAFQFMKAMERASQADPNATVQTRKEIAANGNADSKPEPKKSGLVDAKTARRMGWD